MAKDVVYFYCEDAIPKFIALEIYPLQNFNSQYENNELYFIYDQKRYLSVYINSIETKVQSNASKNCHDSELVTDIAGISTRTNR